MEDLINHYNLLTTDIKNINNNIANLELNDISKNLLIIKKIYNNINNLQSQLLELHNNLYKEIAHTVPTFSNENQIIIPLEKTEKQQIKTNISKIVQTAKYVNIRQYNGVNLPIKCSFPTISSLEELPDIFYYHNGQLYTKINGLTIQVPFINTNGINKINGRHKTLKCRNLLFNQCDNNVHGNCSFTHYGEKFNKIGTITRSPNCISFGNFQTLNEDLEKVNLEDISLILMNALSDLFLVHLWSNKKNIEMELKNLDICS